MKNLGTTQPERNASNRGYRFIFQSNKNGLLYTSDEIPADLWDGKVEYVPGFKSWGYVKPDGRVFEKRSDFRVPYESIGKARAAVLWAQFEERIKREAADSKAAKRAEVVAAFQRAHEQ